MKKLPYRARTTTGDSFDIEFPLHGETRNAVRVGQHVSAVLEAIDRDIALAGETSNGDVLQPVGDKGLRRSIILGGVAPPTLGAAVGL